MTTLTDETLTLEIDGLRIHHNLGPLPRLVFDPDAIEGLHDTPEVRRESTSRPISHGDFSSTGHYGSKVYSITGTALANTPEELQAMRDELVVKVDPGQTHEVALHTRSEVRYINVSQGSALSWIRINDTRARFMLELYASDPRMYGGILTAQSHSQSREGFAIRYPITYPLSMGKTEKASTATISNSGNTEAWPVYTVDATLPSGFSIRNGGRSIVFSGPTFAGTPVVVDTFSGSVTVDGSDRSYQLTKREWTPIPAYGTLPVKFQPLESPQQEVWMNVTWRSAWI